MKRLEVVASVALALSASVFAGPGQQDPVAEGFMDWEGLVPKNFLRGRIITPSDLRHRAVVYVVVDAATFTNDKIPDYYALSTIAALPASHMTQWETQEFPRQKIVVVSVRNMAKGSDAKTFGDVFKVPKGGKQEDATKYSSWSQNLVPFYKDLKAVGEQELTPDKLPYVAVYGGEGTEPLYKQEKWTSADAKSLKAAVDKAAKGLGEWKEPLGVAEPQFFKKVAADLAKGKPAQGLLSALKGGIKSKNQEQAKEAQIMFDALNQYRGDLRSRIMLEYSSAPARAYYDYQLLVKNFPSEKKNMQAFDAKLKANKEIGALGKVFEKVMLWSRDDYVCKNAGEAKKNVMELQKIKKALESLANSQNASIQGEAMLLQSQIDTLIDIMPSKVPQK